MWEYIPPDWHSNIPQLIYDFYALSLIDPDELYDDEFAYAMRDAKKKMVEHTYGFLKYAVIRACVCEMIHFQPFWKPELTIKFLAKYPDHKPLFTRLYTIFNPYHDDYYNRRLLPNYDERWNRYTKTGIDDGDFLIFCKDAYGMTGDFWHSSFGGKAWRQIAESALNLLNVPLIKDVDRAFGIMDHVFDLEHNTGSIFTKLRVPSQSGYILQALDKKKYIKNPVELYKLVSTDLKGPYAAAVKDIYGKTVQGIIQDKEKKSTSNDFKYEQRMDGDDKKIYVTATLTDTPPFIWIMTKIHHGDKVGNSLQWTYEEVLGIMSDANEWGAFKIIWNVPSKLADAQQIIQYIHTVETTQFKSTGKQKGIQPKPSNESNFIEYVQSLGDTNKNEYVTIEFEPINSWHYKKIKDKTVSKSYHASYNTILDMMLDAKRDGAGKIVWYIPKKIYNMDNVLSKIMNTEETYRTTIKTSILPKEKEEIKTEKDYHAYSSKDNQQWKGTTGLYFYVQPIVENIRANTKIFMEAQYQLTTKKWTVDFRDSVTSVWYSLKPDLVDSIKDVQRIAKEKKVERIVWISPDIDQIHKVEGI